MAPRPEKRHPPRNDPDELKNSSLTAFAAGAYAGAARQVRTLPEGQLGSSASGNHGDGRTAARDQTSGFAAQVQVSQLSRSPVLILDPKSFQEFTTRLAALARNLATDSEVTLKHVGGRTTQERLSRLIATGEYSDQIVVVALGDRFRESFCASGLKIFAARKA